MRNLVCSYMGIDVYVWCTGKYEAYLEGTTIGLWSRDLKDLLVQIEKYKGF